MKDLMVDVLPGGAPLQLADTCRISAGDPHQPTECEGRSVPPGGHGKDHPQKDPHPAPPPLCAGTKAPSAGCDRGRKPRRAAELDFLRRELLAQLAGL